MLHTYVDGVMQGGIAVALLPLALGGQCLRRAVQAEGSAGRRTDEGAEDEVASGAQSEQASGA